MLGVIRLKRDQQGLNASEIAQLPILGLFGVEIAGSASEHSYASIFLLIGMIENLLLADSNEEVKAVFYGSCDLPPIFASPLDSTKSGTPDKSNTSEENTPQDLLLKNISTWRKSASDDLSEKIFPSSIFIGKVCERIYFSLANAAESLRPNADFANIMEIFTLCVINAFLIEEAKHHLLEEPTAQASLTLNQTKNPNTSASDFVNKLVSIQPKRNSFPFTAIMATCPLLLALLNGKEKYAQALKPLFPGNWTKEKIQALLCSEEHYALMQKLSIVGAKSSTVDTK
jgi:hypothetical protein